MTATQRLIATSAFALAAVLALTQPTAPAAEEELARRRRFTNSLGMTMVRVEPGAFRMGSTEGDWDERPVHDVAIRRPFYMAAAEVSNAQYEQFDPGHRKYRGIRGVCRADDEAAVYVSWNDAAAFCRWLSAREDRPYRLPTEAEWEYACRAGTTTAFSAGPSLPEAYHRNQPVEGDWSKVRRRKDDDLRAKKGKVAVSLAVDAMPPNAWGLRAMHGNVEEWVLDWYGSYPASRQVDPVGPADGMFRVSRGGSHSTYVRHLRSANRHGTVPGDKHWLIGFRVVQAEMPGTEPRPAVPRSMNDPTVDPAPAEWDEPAEGPLFVEPIPFVVPDEDHPHLAKLDHHHCPTITWCPNGDLLAAWYNTRSEIGREMVIVASRLRHGAERWDTERLFFAPPDRNTTGSCLLGDGRGRLYFFNAIGESSHHRDQSTVMSTSEDSGREWTRPRIVTSLDRRHKFTPMDSALVDDDGTLVLGMDYAPLGHKANEAGSGVFLSRDRGATWIDRITGKAAPNVVEGETDRLAAGFHINVVRLNDGRLMAMGRTGDIEGHVTQSCSRDEGRTWTYRESPFPGIGGGQRLVLVRLAEGPLLLVSFTDARRRRGMPFTDAEGREFTGYGMFAALSFDEGTTWPVRKLLTAGGRRRVVDGGGNTGRFAMDATHAEPAGYLAATQTPDRVIHLISSRLHYRFNLAWLQSPR
jgi:formylglycine-generating enzyme required for sulfatase activity